MDEERTPRSRKEAEPSNDAQAAAQPEGTSGRRPSPGAGCGPEWMSGSSHASGSSKADGPAEPTPGEFASSWRQMMAEMCGEGARADCRSGFFGRPAGAKSGEGVTSAASDPERSE